mmetsp:Transcript_9670/g.16770  ORF Transcript_9670/g.16770 Transcript_9670/m.16770 type:complete len:413 (-) Transcript_9670:239-1477(-)|eukprot:CAMPEP_0196664362 /NCGR_PEP_ID=MMETSP1086-20130531/56857_1 /TAXON_ID=77921 /ORGANISM="Cyanoptyche  gloeocystis , Strain SAG4.97" /LENGTH=412 /DNA_ID=CAMNT_0042000635 /DNA_START=36 /DNA_END=1274 /DNA_ORIENTATION=-
MGRQQLVFVQVSRIPSFPVSGDAASSILRNYTCAPSVRHSRSGPASPSGTVSVFSVGLRKRNWTLSRQFRASRKLAISPRLVVLDSQSEGLAEQNRLDSLKEFEKSGSVRIIKDDKNGIDYVLLGTAHISQKSADDVRFVISNVRPDVVVVELCAERARRLFSGEERKIGFLYVYTLMWKMGLAGFVAGLLNQLYSVAEKSLNVEKGVDFKTAVAESYAVGSTLILGDRDADITLQRIVSGFQKALLIPTGLFGALSLGTLAANDWNPYLLALFLSFAVAFPGISVALFGFLLEKVGTFSEAEVDNIVKSARDDQEIEAIANAPTALVKERDEFLLWSMTKHWRLPEDRKTVVAVVGQAHVSGIAEKFGMKVDVTSLLRIPGKTEAEMVEITEKLRQDEVTAYAFLDEKFKH